MWTGPLLVALASLLALAPDPPPEGPRPPGPPPETAPGGLLAGPKVPHVDEQAGPRGPRGPAAPGVAGGMGGRRRESAVNPRQWFAMLDRIELAPEQREGAMHARRELRQAMDSFEEAHGSRLRELSAKASATRPPGDDLSEDERREFRELRDLRPRADEYMMRIWRLLDENQQEELRRLLAEAAKDRRARDRRAPGRPGDEAGPMGPDDRAPRGEPGLDPMARRRMDFLRRRQAAPPDAPPVREPALPPPPGAVDPSAPSSPPA